MEHHSNPTSNSISNACNKNRRQKEIAPGIKKCQFLSQNNRSLIVSLVMLFFVFRIIGRDDDQCPSDVQISSASPHTPGNENPNAKHHFMSIILLFLHPYALNFVSSFHDSVCRRRCHYSQLPPNVTLPLPQQEPRHSAPPA